MNTYTVWCQDSSGTGPIWVGTVMADDVEGAMEAGRSDCHEAWDGSIDAIHVLGVAYGEVNILYWEDIES